MGAYDMMHEYVHVHVPWFVFAICSLICFCYLFTDFIRMNNVHVKMYNN